MIHDQPADEPRCSGCHWSGHGERCVPCRLNAASYHTFNKTMPSQLNFPPPPPVQAEPSTIQSRLVRPSPSQPTAVDPGPVEPRARPLGPVRTCVSGSAAGGGDETLSEAARRAAAGAGPSAWDTVTAGRAASSPLVTVSRVHWHWSGVGRRAITGAPPQRRLPAPRRLSD